MIKLQNMFDILETIKQQNNLLVGVDANERPASPKNDIDLESECNLLDFFAAVDSYRFIPLKQKGSKYFQTSLQELIDARGNDDTIEIADFVHDINKRPIEPADRISKFFECGYEGFLPTYNQHELKNGIRIKNEKLFITIVPVKDSEVIDTLCNRITEKTFSSKAKPNAAMIQIQFDFASQDITYTYTPMLFSFLTIDEQTFKSGMDKLILKKKDNEILVYSEEKITNKSRLKYGTNSARQIKSFFDIIDITRKLSDLFSQYLYRCIKTEMRTLFRFINTKEFINVRFNGYPAEIGGFFSEDLRNLRRNIEQGIVGDALLDYLNISNWRLMRKNQISLTSNQSLPHYNDILSKTPIVTWPRPYKNSSLQQKVAVNAIFKETGAGDGSVVAIEGPPGTGKSSLTAEFFSVVINDKVRYLTSKDFKPAKIDLRNGSFFFDFGQELRKYSILVISSNNNAVENISESLPNQDYLYENGYRFVGYSSVERRWGRISAALGKRSNLEKYFDEVEGYLDGNMMWVPLSDNFEPADYYKQFRSNLSKVKKKDYSNDFKDPFDHEYQLGVKEPVVFRNEERDELLKTADKEKMFFVALNQYMLAINKHKKILSRNVHFARDYFLNRRVFEENFSYLTPDERSVLIQAIFDTVFFITPILSTTFASSPRLMKELSVDSIGWLVCDEAAQSKSYEIIPALYRSTNLITCGDEKQLEPIKNLDPKLYNHIKEIFLTGTNIKNLIYESSSVQRFAVNASKYVGEIQKRTVGIPLLVHRRCRNPMFQIANRISYDNLMVYGVDNTRHQIITPQWIDIAAADKESFSSGSHYNGEQGKKAFEISIEFYYKCDKADSSVAILSPFASVVEGINRELKETIMPAGFLPEIMTVNKSQGREFDLVILVLGGNPSKPGAFRFASMKPNLLNVAVTRAKLSLVVIGDAASWSGLPYFNTCFRILNDYSSKYNQPNTL